MWTHQPLSATNSSNSRPQTSFAFLSPDSQDSFQSFLPHSYQQSYQTKQKARGPDSFYQGSRSSTSEYTVASSQRSLAYLPRTQYEQQQSRQIEHFRSSKPDLQFSLQGSPIDDREFGRTQYSESEKEQRQFHPSRARRGSEHKNPSPSRVSFQTESAYDTTKYQQKMGKSSTREVSSTRRQERILGQANARLRNSQVSVLPNSTIHQDSYQDSCRNSQSEPFNPSENTLAYFLNQLSNLTTYFQQFQPQEYEVELEERFSEIERKMDSLESQCEAMIKQTRLVHTQIEEYMLDVAEEQQENSQLLKVYEAIISAIRQENMLDNFRN